VRSRAGDRPNHIWDIENKGSTSKSLLLQSAHSVAVRTRCHILPCVRYSSRDNRDTESGEVVRIFRRKTKGALLGIMRPGDPTVLLFFYRYQRSRSSPSQRRRVPTYCTMRVIRRLISSPSTMLDTPVLVCPVLPWALVYLFACSDSRLPVQILSGLSPGPWPF